MQTLIVALKNGRQEVPGSISGRACRPSRLEFHVFFVKICINTGGDVLERSLPPLRAIQGFSCDNWTKIYNQPDGRS